MGTLDWFIIIGYLLGMIGLSVYLGRGQSNQEDYFVGGRKLPWWAVGISTMATQTSAISFISIPAFVALREGGGLTMLQYELAVPLAMILVMVFLIPFFRKLELVSVYEYLEHRYNSSVRHMVSLIFLISRGLGTGVGVYASAIVLSVCLGIPLWATILIIGVVTIIYDTIGGITAVVYSDVIQMVLLMGGLLLCIFYAADFVGGFEVVLKTYPVTRRDAIDFSHGLGDGNPVPFWGFLIGGFFLYASYYGTDQSQVQRELSASSTAETKKSLIWNGLARFPLVALYALLGIFLWAVYQESADLIARVPYNRLDYLVPEFILLFLPPGVRAIIFAALLAAAMSSLDSALNSLSAATVRDFVGRNIKDPKRLLLVSKVTTVAWGIVITGFAFFVGAISNTVIESVNKVSSAFYGPILASFLVGVLSKKTTAPGILIGLPAGVLFNLFLWFTAPGVHWMWWNLFGFVVTAAVAMVISRMTIPTEGKIIKDYVLDWQVMRKHERSWLTAYGMLVAYFLLMLILLIAL